MKVFKRILAAVVLVSACVAPASAQFRFGLRAGMAVNKLHFDKEVVNSSNRTGFTGGLTCEFTVPIVNLGFDASVLYARRSMEVATEGSANSNALGTTVSVANRDYIDIPLNLKWKIGIPVISRIITPFITTGPDFSFLISGKNVSNAWRNKTFDTAWTVGAGVELVRHLQLAANYGFGLSKSASGDDAIYSGKNRCWTVTASYYF